VTGAGEARKPLVKVIVPCYDYAGYLDNCLGSVLGQDGVEVRVLIVDDCSPDDTPAVARRIMDNDDRVEYHRHERNVGLVATINDGLEWAGDGDYVAVLSADDLLVPGSLRRATSVMDSQPRVGMVYGRAPYFESGRPLPRFGRRWRGTKIWRGEDWIRLRCRSGHSCISSPEVVVRTSVQRDAGGYDPACQHACDLNMWLRIAAISDVAYVRGAAQALYRIHPDSMFRAMLAGDAGPIIDLRERRAAFDRFFTSAESRLLDAAGLRQMVARTLARQALWRASRAYDRDQVHNVDGVSAEEWIAFALETCPDPRRLREWWGLRLRQQIGAGRSLWFPLFLATGAGHRLRSHYDRHRIHARGI
jgi:glycosyltransferase involved in cell wall biosynthesis